MEHHSFSPKRVLREIHRLLVPGGRTIVVTPNHASLYNRLKLIFGGTVNDDFRLFFFDMCAEERTYEGPTRIHAGELTAALRRTQFQVRECRVFDQDLTSLLYYCASTEHARRFSGISRPGPLGAGRNLGAFAPTARAMDLGSW